MFLNQANNPPTDGSTPQKHDYPAFAAARCIFCDKSSIDFTANVSHMQINHGFTVPAIDLLIVDLETLIDYLNLVIGEYFQCTFCLVQLSSRQAAQQHMMAKGHCMFDIADRNSEFRDFYDLEQVMDIRTSTVCQLPVDGHVTFTEAATLRLPSGRVAITGHGHARINKYQHRGTGSLVLDSVSSETDQSLVAAATRQSLSLSKSTKRGQTDNQVQSRATDRGSLSHLTLPQQRAQAIIQKKQLDGARRERRLMESRVQTLGNKTLMRHFVPDTPGRSNG